MEDLGLFALLIAVVLVIGLVLETKVINYSEMQKSCIMAGNTWHGDPKSKLGAGECR